MFKSKTGILVEEYGKNTQSVQEPNVMFFEFAITVRDIEQGGQHIRIGALSLQLWHRKRSQPNSNAPALSKAIPHQPVSYPFLISDNISEMKQDIIRGIHFLADHLPSYFDCADKIGNASCRIHMNSYDESFLKLQKEDKLQGDK